MKNKLLFCLLLTGCQGLVGSGTVVTSEREIGAFRKVSIASGIDAKAVLGARSLSIRTDDNLQSVVETFVQGDTLVVRLQQNTFIGLDRIEANIGNDVFEGLDASGGSHVTMTATPTSSFAMSIAGGSTIDVSELSTGDFTLDASGGSDATVKGTSTHASVSAAGGSTLRLTGVPLESLTLDASGGSTVNARVSSSLTGAVSGGSTVTIVGSPSNGVDRSGGSQVILGAQ